MASDVRNGSLTEELPAENQLLYSSYAALYRDDGR